MKSLIWLICGMLILSLPTLADPLVFSASGRGTSEVAAIGAAKQQAAKDAQLAGFLPRDGYRISGTRVADITRNGTTYMARVDADLVKDLEAKRVVFVISGQESQSPRLLALVQRVRNLLAEQRSGRQPHIEVVDTPATGLLRNGSLADLQLPGMESELEQMARTQRADLLYLLSANSETSPIFLVGAKADAISSKTIRTLRHSTGGSFPPLTTQVVEAVRQDAGWLSEISDKHSVITLETSDVSVRKGQSVIIYADKSSDGGVRESSIVTHGIVTELSGTRVRVLTEQPVVASPNRQLRLSPLPKRGIIITESDW
jgi:hypothetical protein